MSFRVGREGGQDYVQKYPEPGQDAPEVVSGGSEGGIGGVAGMALEVAAPEMSLLFHVADEGFGGGSPP